MSGDPLAGDYASWTPYHYVHNNPLNMVDPTGMEGESIHQDKNGKAIAEIDDGFDQVITHDDLDIKEQGIEATLVSLYNKRIKHGWHGGGTTNVRKTDWIYNFRALKGQFQLNMEAGEGAQQQHSGENWVIFGKGAKNGWAMTAPRYDSDQATKVVDISDMLTPGIGLFGKYVRHNTGKYVGRVNDFANGVNTSVHAVRLFNKVCLINLRHEKRRKGIKERIRRRDVREDEVTFV